MGSSAPKIDQSAQTRRKPSESDQTTARALPSVGSLMVGGIEYGLQSSEDKLRTLAWALKDPATRGPVPVWSPYQMAETVGKRSALGAAALGGLGEGIRSYQEDGASAPKAVARGASYGACVGGWAYGGAKTGAALTAVLAPETVGAAPVVAALIGSIGGAAIGSLTCKATVDVAEDAIKKAIK